MKAMLEIPDHLFREAEVEAARQGIPLCELVAVALTEKLRKGSGEGKPWMRSFGQLAALKRETARIQSLIDREFGLAASADLV